MNNNEKSVKFLLRKIQDLQSEIAQMKNQALQKSRFNRKLCSQNRKRRIKNRDLLQKQHSKISMIENLKSKQEQYNNILNNYTNALDQSNKKLDELQEQILVLKTQITKEKQKNYNDEVQIRGLKQKLQKKDREIERYTFIQKEIIQKKHKIETRQPSNSQDQVIVLLCKNDELQGKIKELQKTIAGFLNKIGNSQERIKELLDDLQSTKTILTMMGREHEEEISQLNSKISSVYLIKEDKNASGVLTTEKDESLLNVIDKADEQNLSIAYGKRLQYRNEQYFSAQCILYDKGTIQNYMNKPIYLHFCEPIKNNLAGTWFAKIKLTGYNEIYFGISNQIINEAIQSNSRHFLYYNNCSGLIVIDKLGKFIDKYCTKNETITMKISITSNEKVISFFINDKQVYKAVIPPELSKGDSFYPFIKLLGDMSVILR